MNQLGQKFWEKYFRVYDVSEPVPAVSADREKLKAALFNIVDNAVKCTTKGEVSVKISNSQFPISNQNQNLKSEILNHKSILIVVKDTGIGIEE